MENFIAEEIVRIVATSVLFLPPVWFIFKKAGFNPWLSLITIVPPFPLGILVAALFLGLKKWPNSEGAQ